MSLGPKTSEDDEANVTAPDETVSRASLPRGPARAVPVPRVTDPAKLDAWFRATMGNIPAPTVDMDARSEQPERGRQREAVAVLERTIPPVYRWARLDAPELSERVGRHDRRAVARKVWREPRIVFMGAARTGKTSLAVALLRRAVAETGRLAGFFHAYQLGVARIQHQAGHGEPELVERATRMPLVLLDDMGNERDTAANALPDVIFARHAEDRPLWVTTGLSRPQLVARYGAGIVGRMLERSVLVQLGTTTPEPGETARAKKNCVE